jgi:hypothetical protein
MAKPKVPILSSDFLDVGPSRYWPNYLTTSAGLRHPCEAVAAPDGPFRV